MTIAAMRVQRVAPPTATVLTGVEALRAEPRDESELVDQLRLDERVTVLADREGWAFVQGPDLYFGWVRSDRLRARTYKLGPVVSVTVAPRRRAPADDAPVIDHVSAGAVALKDGEKDWLRCGDGWVSARDCGSVRMGYPTPDDIVLAAEAFLGAPYLWGGVSALGIDCSGLTQQVYLLNGVGLPRDADQQALAGRPVDADRPPRRGDLLFFGDARVTHTAIATGERSYIHAPEKGGAVARGTIADAPQLLGIRRYLP
ncbi:MAG TPA: C40 family peptidase [Candidatus Limnocylindria bacterium]|nr:C40 family peptidase [Candidatus Limnocylindria bacterium]